MRLAITKRDCEMYTDECKGKIGSLVPEFRAELSLSKHDVLAFGKVEHDV